MISVIVTIYNSEKYLKQCLDSIKNQTYKDFEVVMVDDGSTDGSRAIALSYLTDDRFKLFGDKHVGFPEAKNIGLKNVTGDYIIFFDSDDIAHPQWLKLLIKAIEDNNADIAYCSYTKFTDSRSIKNDLLDIDQISITDMTYQKMCPLFYHGCRNYMWNKLIKKDLYKDIYFEDCPIMSDVQVMYKMFDKANKVYRVKASLVNYRKHPESTCAIVGSTAMFPRYRLEHTLDVLSFIFDKYEISKFICRRTLEKELFALKQKIAESEYNIIYNDNKNKIEHILKDDYECNFDVDLVVPFVDNRDLVWQQAYTKTLGRNDFENNNRYDHPDLFKYFLQGVDKFMPWVRKIHLIVSNIEQVPNYINKEKTHIVLHKDIIPACYLPTFNSSTIEMFISKIDGLSEHFIYSNDDMYPIAPLLKSDFFSEDGKPKVVFKIKTIKENMTFFNTLCLNVYQHTAEALNYPYDNKTFLRPEHTMSAFILSHCKDCFNKMWNYIKQDLGPVRTVYQHTQYMYCLYDKFTNYYTFGGPAFVYHDLDDNYKNILDLIQYRGCKIICLNGVSEDSVSKDSLIKIEKLLANNISKIN